MGETMIQCFANGAMIVCIDGEWVPCFSGGNAGGSYSQSKSQSHSASGLRGTPYSGRAAEQAFQGGMDLTGLSHQLASSPGATMNMGRQMLGSGKYGLGENADAGVEALGKFQFGQASGNSATRGQTNPENMSAVIGSSMQNMLPFLIPQMQEHQYAQFQAPQSLMGNARTAADYWNRTLGAQSDASAKSMSVSAQGGIT